MVVGEWSLALGGRGKAALPASQVLQTSFFGFSGWVFETPYRWGYHGDIVGMQWGYNWGYITTIIINYNNIYIEEDIYELL